MIDSVFDLKNKKIIKLNKLQDEKLESVLFVKGKKRYKFFTNDSGLYFNCNDKNALIKADASDKLKFFDSLNYKTVREYNNLRGSRGEYLYEQYCVFAKRMEVYQNEVIDKKNILIDSISVFKLWNASILAAIVIGMISMSFIYRYLGPGVSAKDDGIKEVATEYIEEKNEKKWSKEKEEEYLTSISEYLKIEADKDFNIRAKELVKGYPIAEMMPYIIEKDPKVAAFYIAIAKKESNWGKRVPVLNGKDCYNYVGYRGKSEKKGSGGHTCFKNRKEAVDVVSKRIKDLIEIYDRDTAKEMVVWKCGSSCAATGGQAAANKWIDDVDHILEKLNKDDK
jgi:hypothetical protein